MRQSTPNLVFIFPDQFRQMAIGSMGQDPVVTPNLDRLASEGLVLTHAVSNFPLCSPYRAMLLTGKFPFGNGVISNCNSWASQYEVFLKEDDACFSDLLNQAGYSTGYIGKWHLDPPGVPLARCLQEAVWDAYTPPGPRRHGFDFWHSYGCMNHHLKPYYWIGDDPEEKKTYFDQWSVEHEADVAIDYIMNRDRRYRDPNQSFALFVALNPPHTPFEQVPPEYVLPYADASIEQLLNRPNFLAGKDGEIAGRQVRNYFAAVTGIDQQIGRILTALEQTGLREDTIVVFTADHGEMMGSHGLMHKNVWYDESLLVPFIIRWPGKLNPGRDDLLFSVPDVMPSILGLMGLESRIPQDVEGNDYSDALHGRDIQRPRSALYLYVNPEHPESGSRGLRTHDYTFVVQARDGTEEVLLYDNRSDPYQIQNIADARPQVVEELRNDLTVWLTRTGDPWITGHVLKPDAGDPE